MHNETPSYLSRLLISYRPSRVLRSSSSSNLSQVHCTDLIFNSRSFHAAAPTIWNTLPDTIRSSDTFNTFGAILKHTLSKQFVIFSSDNSDTFIRLMALYKCFTYLLTYFAIQELVGGGLSWWSDGQPACPHCHSKQN